MDVLFTDVLLPVVNTLLAVGLPLPSLPGVALVAPQLQFGEGYVALSANVSGSALDGHGSLTTALPHQPGWRVGG